MVEADDFAGAELLLGQRWRFRVRTVSRNSIRNKRERQDSGGWAAHRREPRPPRPTKLLPRENHGQRSATNLDDIQSLLVTKDIEYTRAGEKA